MLKVFQENKELAGIIVYVVIGSFILMSLFVIIATGTNLAKSEMSYDSVAEVEIDNKNTGSISEQLITIIGVENIAGIDIDENINAKSIITLRQYLTLVLPEAESISIKKNSVWKDGDSYGYEVISNTNNKYKIIISDLKNGNFRLNVSDERNEILNFETENYINRKKDSRTLSSYLPKFWNDMDPPVSLTKRNDGTYQINVNSCGDENIKQSAKNIVDQWLEDNSFDSSKIKYIIPTFCDGEN